MLKTWIFVFLVGNPLALLTEDIPGLCLSVKLLFISYLAFQYDRQRPHHHTQSFLSSQMVASSDIFLDLLYQRAFLSLDWWSWKPWSCWGNCPRKPWRQNPAVSSGSRKCLRSSGLVRLGGRHSVEAGRTWHSRLWCLLCHPGQHSRGSDSVCAPCKCSPCKHQLRHLIYVICSSLATGIILIKC